MNFYCLNLFIQNLIKISAAIQIDRKLFMFMTLRFLIISAKKKPYKILKMLQNYQSTDRLLT